MNTDTVKIDRKNCKMIAHRGVCGVETENTCPAFVFAGARSYYGIETDVHVTGDGKYVICHDDDLKRMAGIDVSVEKATLAMLRQVRLPDHDGSFIRSDLFLPTLEEYIAICRKYKKVAVLELKNKMEATHINAIVAIIKDMGWFDQTVFISFCGDNLVAIRELCPDATVQFLCGELKEDTLEFLKKYHFSADMWEGGVTKEVVDAIHAAGLELNVWTVNDPQNAAKYIEWGVDYITTNILE